MSFDERTLQELINHMNWQIQDIKSEYSNKISIARAEIENKFSPMIREKSDKLEVDRNNLKNSRVEFKSIKKNLKKSKKELKSNKSDEAIKNLIEQKLIEIEEQKIKIKNLKLIFKQSKKKIKKIRSEKKREIRLMATQLNNEKKSKLGPVISQLHRYQDQLHYIKYGDEEYDDDYDDN